MLADLVSLFFPDNCQACQAALMRHEKHVCTKCQFEMPYTRFHDDPENKVAQLFWGKTTPHAVTALFHFDKLSRIQLLIHALKYRGHTGVGEHLGTWLGQELASATRFQGVTCVIPVPLHPKKLKQRGYNQSDFIAKGVANALQIETMNQQLVRVRHSESQTRKSRFERWQNVASIFEVKNPEALEGAHILLVDDVVSTGSTLEACINTLLEIPRVKVSVACLACA